MNGERKEIRKFLKKSLKSDFEKILYEAKMTADEENHPLYLLQGYVCGKNCGTVTTIPAAVTNTVIE